MRECKEQLQVQQEASYKLSAIDFVRLIVFFPKSETAEVSDISSIAGVS